MDKPRRGVRWSDLPALPLPDLGDYIAADYTEALAAAHRDHPGFDAVTLVCASCRDAEVSPGQEALTALSRLEPDQRLDVLRRFCRSCGVDDPSCQCWNDE